MDAASRGAGFTPGFASVLTCADGSRHFVKAASVKAQRMFAEAYRVEARKLSALPDEAPAPRLLWTHEDDWVVLSTEYVEARHPHRPWRQADLESSLDMLEASAAALTPAPEGLELDDFATEFAEWPAYWDHIRAARPDLAARRRGRRAGGAVRRGDGRHDGRAHRRARRQHPASLPTAAC